MQSFEQVLIALLFCLAIVLICQKIKRLLRRKAIVPILSQEKSATIAVLISQPRKVHLSLLPQMAP